MSSAFHLGPMETVVPPVSSNEQPDITFACVHCASALVVDSAAQGMTLACQKCGKPTQVPSRGTTPGGDPANSARLSDLERQLKENESQRTEITAYINQHSIQLHRWQLRLQTLNERHQELQKQLRSGE